MTSSRWREGGGSGKCGQNLDGSGWSQGEGEEICRNWMFGAIISIRAQTAVWFCYKCSRQVSGSALDNILVLFLAFPVKCFCLSFTAEY